MICPVIFLYSSCLFTFLFSIILIRSSFIDNNETVNEKLSKLFILSSVFNISWIFAWHYDVMNLSIVLMLALLFTLIRLYQVVSEKSYASIWSYLSVYTPISLYLGWICIATVANFSVWLSSMKWDGSPFNAAFWASLMVIVAAFINLFILVKKRDIVFALVYIWAAYGITMARSVEMSDGSLWVYRSAITGMILVFLGVLYAVYYKIQHVKVVKP